MSSAQPQPLLLSASLGELEPHHFICCPAEALSTLLAVLQQGNRYAMSSLEGAALSYVPIVDASGKQDHARTIMVDDNRMQSISHIPYNMPRCYETAKHVIFSGATPDQLKDLPLMGRAVFHVTLA